MATKLQALLNFIIVFFALLIILAVISPSQFQIVFDTLAKNSSLLVVVLVVALVAYILRKLERI